MEIKKINHLIRYIGDFNLLRREKQWSGNIDEKSKFNRLKMEYTRSRTDHSGLLSEDNFNTLRISV
jgi:hypothetical protein